MSIEVIPTLELLERRGDGCDTRCRVVRIFQAGVFGRQELLVHSPEAHERYGRVMAFHGSDRDVVRTGALVIDRDAGTATVDGREIHLTRTEWKLLLLLAERQGCVVAYPKLIRSLWQLDDSDAAELSMLRTVLGRVRIALGPRAAGLIETCAGRGLRLVDIAPGRAAPKVFGGRLGGRWSQKHPRCVVCGTTDRPHDRLGACRPCFMVVRRVGFKRGRRTDDH